MAADKMLANKTEAEEPTSSEGPVGEEDPVVEDEVVVVVVGSGF